MGKNEVPNPRLQPWEKNLVHQLALAKVLCKLWLKACVKKDGEDMSRFNLLRFQVSRKYEEINPRLQPWDRMKYLTQGFSLGKRTWYINWL